MKTIFVVLLLLTPCLSQEKVHFQFEETIKHIDLDGEFLSLSNEKGLVKQACKMTDDMLGPMIDVTMGHGNLRFEKLVEVWHLNKIEASGISAKKHNQCYTNKWFIQGQDLHKGIFSLIGSSDRDSSFHKLAPVNSDLLLELNFSGAKIADLVLGMAQISQPSLFASMRKMFDEPIPESKHSPREMFANCNLRLAAAGSWHNEGIKKVNLQFSARIDGFTNQNLEQLPPGTIERLTEYIEGKREGDVISGAIPLKLQELSQTDKLLVKIDLTKNEVWVSTSQEHLLSCLDITQKKLAENKDFQLAFARLPEQRNLQFYLSKSVRQNLIKMAVESMSFTGEDNPTVQGVITLWQGFHRQAANCHGMAFAFDIMQKGVLVSVETPFRIRPNIVTFYAVPIMLMMQRSIQGQ